MVMAEKGHNDPGVALRIFAQAMRRDEADRERLVALVEGAQLATIGNRVDLEPAEDASGSRLETAEPHGTICSHRAKTGPRPSTDLARFRGVLAVQIELSANCLRPGTGPRAKAAVTR